MAQERLISDDSHVNPPKDLWVRNAPSKLRDRAPRVESTAQGDFWIVDSRISGAIGLDASAGRKPEEFKAYGLSYKDMRPGSYDPAARLAEPARRPRAHPAGRPRRRDGRACTRRQGRAPRLPRRPVPGRAWRKALL